MFKWQDDYILENGQLNDSIIVKREPLETITKGRIIERVYTTPEESFIFKRFTNDSQSGKEIWVQENILTSFPNFYPKIIAYSFSVSQYTGWTAFTDLGSIKHEYTSDILNDVTKQIVWWHSLPVGMWKNAPLSGLKPKIEEIKMSLMQSKNKINKYLSIANIPKRYISVLFSHLEKWEFSKELVLSHGDLHTGNFGMSQNKLVILDWEYAHLNTRYWDLYHLIDLSHPLYPKKVTSELRNQILNEYFNRANSSRSKLQKESFKAEYYLFSATFSLWMIMLIVEDLKRKDNRWTEEVLMNQLDETSISFVQCIEELTKGTSLET
jgi:thiamine kinase-like enzyme